MASIIRQVYDGEDFAERINRMGTAGRRLARGILREGSAPILAAIQSGIHDVSGALKAGTKLRAGRGDRPGRYSVYVASRTTRRSYAKRLRKIGRGRRAAFVTRSPVSGGDPYRLFYWLFVEKGHKHRRFDETRGEHGSIWSVHGKTGRRTPAHPFIAPGFDATSDGALDTIETKALDGAMEPFEAT